MTCIRLIPAALLALAAAAGPAAASFVVTFENNSFPPGQPQLTGPNQYQNGSGLSGSFNSAGAVFNNSYDSTYGSWSGWSYSNVFDNTTPAFTNQYAAYNLLGAPLANGAGPSANYGVAFDFNPGDATIALPASQQPLSIQITNTTYTALTIRNGDPYGFSAPFAAGDYFLLTITGLNAQNQSTGAVNFYLANYQGGQSSVVSAWTTVDLSPLGAGTTTLSFGLSASADQYGAFGLNTPAYFAADNLVLGSPPVTPTPAPASGVLMAVGGVVVWAGRRVRRGPAAG